MSSPTDDLLETHTVRPVTEHRMQTRLALRAGALAAWISRRLGLGAGAVVGGRVALALDRSVLGRLAEGRTVVLVTGTNGKTTTCHLLAAAMRVGGSVAHNATGANMVDGAVAALAADRDARVAVLEVDELHLAAVAEAVRPAVMVLLNLSRDQLDRGSEVRAVAASVAGAVAMHPAAAVVANADDPTVVGAVARSPYTTWVSTRGRWNGDASGCPRCGRPLRPTCDNGGWDCRCGLTRPEPHWTVTDTGMRCEGRETPVPLSLPGAFNRDNAVMAIATASLLGVDPQRAAVAMAAVPDVAGRYTVLHVGEHRARLLLAKNPAGWAETIGLLRTRRPLLLVVNAREADGRDTSWLWDVAFEELTSRPVVVAGERAADAGVRLSYAGVEHRTVSDPAAGLALLPPGDVDVVANYTAFHQLRSWSTAGPSLR